MTTDEISKQSLRTLCIREMERRGDYVQVSIFAKTILDLLEELATLRAQLDAVVGQETAILWAAKAVREHGSDYKNGNHATALWKLVDAYTPPLKAGQ